MRWCTSGVEVLAAGAEQGQPFYELRAVGGDRVVPAQAVRLRYKAAKLRVVFGAACPPSLWPGLNDGGG